MEKSCSKCNEVKSITEFHKCRGGYAPSCKVCKNEINKKYREENKEKIKELHKEYNKTEKAKESKKKWSDDNPNYWEDYYDKNINNIKEYNKEYYVDNKDLIIYNSKQYYLNNTEYKKQQSLERHYRLKDTLEYKESSRLNVKKYAEKYPYRIAWRTCLSNTLIRLGTKKSGRTIEMLGYSAEDLKTHMEKLFEDGMSWGNHGDWHIDHKYPVSLFDKNADVSIVNALENLQPLWSEENLKKGNKWMIN